MKRHLALGLLSALCLCAQVGSSLHFVLVRHQRCAEHGELIEAGVQNHAHAFAMPRAEAATSAILERAGSASEGAVHEHCAATSDRRPLAAKPPSCEHARAPAVTARAPGAARHAQDPLAAVRWLLAPKVSPPV